MYVRVHVCVCMYAFMHVNILFWQTYVHAFCVKHTCTHTLHIHMPTRCHFKHVCVTLICMYTSICINTPAKCHFKHFGHCWRGGRCLGSCMCHIDSCVCMYIYIYIYIYTHTHTQLSMCVTLICMYMCTCINSYVCCIDLYAYIYIYIYIYICKHTR